MNINTLTDFLQQAQCQFRIYDLGRKVTKISNSAIQKIAENKLNIYCQNSPYRELNV